MNAYVTCPSCQGETNGLRPCPDCCNEGQVTPAHAARIRRETAEAKAEETRTERTHSEGDGCDPPHVIGAATLHERVSEAIGRQTHYLAADAALTVVAEWLREQAGIDHTWQDSTDPRSVREVLEWLAERVESGEASDPDISGALMVDTESGCR